MKRIAVWILGTALLLVLLCGGAAAEQQEEMEPVRDLAWPYYEDAAEVAQDSPDYGRAFTDHKEDHALMVAIKAVEAGSAIEEAARLGTLPVEAAADRVAFSTEIDYMTLAGAALFHDTGMYGNGYALEETADADGAPTLAMREDGLYRARPEDNLNFSEVRTYHSLNSALYVLASREELREFGYTDVEIDKMAAECMAHSKSNSGVQDLNSRFAWEECFLRLDSVVAAWNEERAGDPIAFDRTPFETDGDLLSALATETLALRVGDVSRDSGPDAEVQTGETVHVERDTLNNRGGSVPGELEQAVIFIAETNDPVENLKSRQVHAGEQNIVENHTLLNDEGIVTHEITVLDGCSAPRCTQGAVEDHLGEFYSARDGKFIVRMIFLQFEDADGFFRDSWEDFRLMAADFYPNLTLQFPWDEEESK